MNRLTLFTICLLTGTADFALSQDQPKTNALDALEMAAPDSLIVSKAKTPAALAPVKDFHLFDGEWKGHSGWGNDAVREEISGTIIRNGICTFEGDQFSYRVLKSDQRHALLVNSQTTNSPEHVLWIVERLEYVMFLRIAGIVTLSDDAAVIDVEFAHQLADSDPQSSTLEFWRIDPQRKKVVQQLENSLFDVNRHRLTGTPEQLIEAKQKVQQITLQLEQLDAAPELQSLTYQVVAARKEGKHDEAKLLEQQVAALSLPAASMATTATGSSDKTTQQDVSDRITDTQIELDSLTRSLGSGHPEVREIQQRLIFLRTLQSDNKSSAEASAKKMTASRTQLEKDRQSLLAEYDAAQQEAQKAASNLRRTSAQDSVTPDEVLSLQKQLRKTVTAAFNAQQKLQTVRLSIAERDLQILRLKQDRRKSLAAQVIERRMQQLLQDDELQWSISGHSTPQSQVPTVESIVTRRANDTRDQQAPTDPDLAGEWALVQASETDFMALKQDSLMSIKGNQLLLSRYGRQLKMRLQTNSNVSPKQIDLIEESDLLTRFTGIYKIEGDVLRITWAPINGSAPRPTKFLGEGSSMQIWKRISPLPVFDTPQELLTYFDFATQNDNPDLDNLVRLFTDEEANRFAGFLIASMGMMQRMIPLLMMADTDSEAPDLTTITAISALLRTAVAPNAPPECVQAFRDLTKPDFNFLSNQRQLSIPNKDAFSEKLRLAGQAVGDSRLFSVHLMRLAERMSNNPSESKKDKSKSDWLVTQEGDKAIAVNLAIVKEDNQLGDGQLHLVRMENTWKITRIIDDKSLTDLAATTMGPIIGTDENGNKVPLSSVFGALELSAQPTAIAPSVRAVEAPASGDN